jgi:hypothetical protein
MTVRLGSWTRTLNEEDAVALLLEASTGQQIDDWEERAHAMLPQPTRARRQETVRMVRDWFLDVDEGKIVRTTWLRLFQEGSPGRRRDLLHARMHAERPWTLRAIDELVLPKLAVADEPLAPRDAGVVTPDDWAAFFDRNIIERTPAEAAKKTRTTVQLHLVRLGVLAADTSSDRRVVVQHAEPDELAFAWLLHHELIRDRRTEASEVWALDRSVAARLFATRRTYAARCVDAAVAAGFVHRGYLAGASRLHPSSEGRA